MTPDTGVKPSGTAYSSARVGSRARLHPQRCACWGARRACRQPQATPTMRPAVTKHRRHGHRSVLRSIGRERGRVAPASWKSFLNRRRSMGRRRGWSVPRPASSEASLEVRLDTGKQRYGCSSPAWSRRANLAPRQAAQVPAPKSAREIGASAGTPGAACSSQSTNCREAARRAGTCMRCACMKSRHCSAVPAASRVSQADGCRLYTPDWSLDSLSVLMVMRGCQ